MDIAWEDMRLFLAIAESGSLSAGARRLRIGQPTASRRLADLEYRLGYQLFRRLPAGVALTTPGERLLEPARRMAEWAGEVTRAAAKADHKPRGLVRVAAAPGVAFDFLAPFAAHVRKRYPELRLEVLASIQYLDLARGEADLALRSRPPSHPDLSLVGKLEHENAVFVSREYARRLPAKPGPADLAWIAWAPPYDNLPPNPELEALIPNFAPAFSSDNFLVMVRAAESGLGAMVLGRVRNRFAPKTNLVPLPFDLGPHKRSTLHLVAARSALEIPRVRAVADAITEELGRAVLF
jgi:DNA-binding transcriptional LysR family regulator